MLYFAAGRLGLSVPFTSGNVSPVWPPSGLALAAVLLWGYGVWPGIAVGAFLVNFLSPIPTLAAVGLAIGNTASAIAGAYLLRRLGGWQAPRVTLRDALALATCAIASPIIAATVGTTTLFLSQVRPWSHSLTAFRIYWFGDAMGVLVVTPLLLTGYQWRNLFQRKRALELLSLSLACGASTIVIFSRVMGFSVRDDVLAFAVFPFVIWAAIRFRTAGASAACFLIAVIAVWGTAEGYGPFLRHDPVHNAVLLQLFLAVLSISGLTLAAVIDERSHAELALADLSGQLLQLQDQERRRLARELHDSTGQNLAALQMNLATVQRRARGMDPMAAQSLLNSAQLAEQVLKEIRTISYLLHPPLLDEAGLTSAIQWYIDGLVQRSSLTVDLQVPATLERLSEDLEIAIFRIIQECLSKVHRHSGSSAASIQMTQTGDHILITVRDQGKGVPFTLLPESSALPLGAGVGIRGMRERVREFGGRLRIAPAFPGTLIEIRLPRLPANATVRSSPEFESQEPTKTPANGA
jgi:signal transduction histidine kinase